MDFAKEKYDFYKGLYDDEITRSKYYDKMIQFPTSLLIIFISGFIFFTNSYFENRNPCHFDPYDIFVYTLIGLFSFCCVLSLFFLARAFHGFTRAYEYLPTTAELQKREDEYYRYKYKCSSKSNFNDKRKEVIQKTFYNIRKEVIKYYISMTEHNQNINDNRADMLYKTRIFLLIDLVILIIFGIVLI